jgi:branched-subunit amino acid ABC-type transport system permease component
MLNLRYKADADIEMLGLILAGELREEVYTQQLQMVDQIMAALERAELDMVSSASQVSGVLPWAKFEHTVRSLFPVKRDDLLEEVLQAARQQQPTGFPMETKGDVETIKFELHHSTKQGFVFILSFLCHAGIACCLKRTGNTTRALSSKRFATNTLKNATNGWRTFEKPCTIS